MIRVALLTLARCLLEAALMLLAVGLLLAIVSFRIGRRLTVGGRDPFEQLSSRAAMLSNLFPRATPTEEEE